jgi:DNA-binding CsgD family transcriptional regulator
VTVLRRLPPSRELGWALSTWAGWQWDRADAPGASINEEAISIAEELGDQALLCTALNSRGTMATYFGSDGVPDLRLSIELAQSIGDEEQIGRGYTNLVDALVTLQRYPEAEATYRTGIAYVDEHDLGTYGNCMRGGISRALDHLGRWDEMEALLSFDLRHRHLSPINRLAPLWLLGRMFARRGQHEQVTMIDESVTLSLAAGEPSYIAEAAVARLEAAWLAGDVAQMRAAAALLVDHISKGASDGPLLGSAATWLRRTQTATIDPTGASRPYALELDGEWQAAASAWLELRCPYDAGLALLDSGDAVAVREAITLFDKVGATATIAVAQAELRRLGAVEIPRGRRASTRDDKWGLTRREREVLALVTDGLTNADIAGRLFIAEKTVDNHVAAVLAKMGVASRRDAARLAAESPAPLATAT